MDLEEVLLGEKLLVDHVFGENTPALHPVLMQYEDVEPVLQLVLVRRLRSHPDAT